MALLLANREKCPGSIALTFAGGALKVLHADAGNGGNAPTGINYLPSQLFVNATTGNVLAFKDFLGTVNTITFAAPFVGVIPVAASTIEATTTAAVTVTVIWQSGQRASI